MSTLYEALRKAEKKNNHALPKKNNKDSKLLLVIVLAVIFAGVVSLQAVRIKNIRNREAGKKNNKKLASAKASNRQRQVPVFEKKKYNGYVLEGIIYNEGAPMAVINGKILRKNGKIDDLTVTNITPNKVELLNSKNNSTITLSL